MQGNRRQQRFSGQKQRLDAAKLDSLALFYVARFATTKAKLVRYLERKLYEGEWTGEQPPNPVTIAVRLAEQGFIDDVSYAVAKSDSMSRRGYGERRVRLALQQAGIETDDSDAVLSGLRMSAEDAALQFARKRRFGPFASATASPEVRQKQLAAFARAGHEFKIACKILDLHTDFVQDQYGSS
jgi:regulatory protein